MLAAKRRMIISSDTLLPLQLGVGVGLGVGVCRMLEVL